MSGRYHAAARAGHTGGFTLVEIAIVLAIIGLMVGGVLAGQYTLRQSQLQTLVSDFTNYKAAYLDFRDEYGGMPGDIIDAVDYWGTDSDGCPSHSNRVPKKETCNGSGDNQIASADGGTTWSEPWRAWQQLSNAGYIKGTFSGVAGSGGIYHAVIGVNAPRSKISNTGFSLYSTGPWSSDTNWFDMPLSVILRYGLQTSASVTSGAALTPREAKFVDGKIDDGMPALGAMRTNKTNTYANCATGNTTSDTYKLTYTSMACGLIYIIDQ